MSVLNSRWELRVSTEAVPAVHKSLYVGSLRLCCSDVHGCLLAVAKAAGRCGTQRTLPKGCRGYSCAGERNCSRLEREQLLLRHPARQATPKRSKMGSSRQVCFFSAGWWWPKACSLAGDGWEGYPEAGELQRRLRSIDRARMAKYTNTPVAQGVNCLQKTITRPSTGLQGWN